MTKPITATSIPEALRTAAEGEPVLVRLRRQWAGSETSAIAAEYLRHRQTREQSTDPRIKAYAAKQCRELAELIADREGLDCVDRDHVRGKKAAMGKHRPSPRVMLADRGKRR